MAIRMLERLTESEFWQKPRNRYVTIAAAVVLLAAAVGSSAWLTFHAPPYAPGTLNQTLWMCKNGHQFTLTAKQLNDFYAKNYGEPVKCPVCGEPAERAVKCPHCGNIVAPGASRICPVCKQPLSQANAATTDQK